MPAFDAGVGPSVPLPALPPLPAGPLPGLPTGLLGAAALALLGDPTWEAPADSAPGTSGRGQARGRDPAVDRFADAAFSDLRSMFVQLYGQETRSKNRTWLVKQVRGLPSGLDSKGVALSLTVANAQVCFLFCTGGGRRGDADGNHGGSGSPGAGVQGRRGRGRLSPA